MVRRLYVNTSKVYTDPHMLHVLARRSHAALKSLSRSLPYIDRSISQPPTPSQQYSKMNHPRNRQPRPPRQQGPPRHQRGPRAPRQNNNGNVPTIQQVIPGAAVSIVLKEDQPTGREVQGIVQDVLTKGNHPRGIKVRMRDGRVGRVQRMGSASQTTSQPTGVDAGAGQSQPKVHMPQYHDVRNDEYPSEPPPRTLFDFLPPTEDTSTAASLSASEAVTFSSATVKCPICGNFEGDEAAVSHHVDEHLS